MSCFVLSCIDLPQVDCERERASERASEIKERSPYIMYNYPFDSQSGLNRPYYLSISLCLTPDNFTCQWGNPGSHCSDKIFVPAKQTTKYQLQTEKCFPFFSFILPSYQVLLQSTTWTHVLLTIECTTHLLYWQTALKSFWSMIYLILMNLSCFF